MDSIGRLSNASVNDINIVDYAQNKVRDAPGNFQDVPEAVGVDAILAEVEERLRLETHTFVGIYGRAGSGKSTVAKLFFNRWIAKFEYTCYVNNYKLIQGEKEEIKTQVWKRVYRHGERVKPSEDGQFLKANFWNQVFGKKLLLVFDDISTKEDLELLEEIADINYHYGSLFIATSDNQDLLSRMDNPYICSLPPLEPEDARRLLCSHAFPHDDHEHRECLAVEVVNEVVERCEGLPLLLEVIGKLLRDHTSEKSWGEVRNILKSGDRTFFKRNQTDQRLWYKLSASFNTLTEEEQDMFLDVASVFTDVEFQGENGDCLFQFDEVMCAWVGLYGIHANARWDTLVSRSLVYKAKEFQGGGFRFQMHEALKAMGLILAQKKGRLANPRPERSLASHAKSHYHDLQGKLEQVVGFRLDGNKAGFGPRGYSLSKKSATSTPEGGRPGSKWIQFASNSLLSAFAGDDRCSLWLARQMMPQLKGLRYLVFFDIYSCTHCDGEPFDSQLMPPGLVEFYWKNSSERVFLPATGEMVSTAPVYVAPPPGPAAQRWRNAIKRVVQCGLWCIQLCQPCELCELCQLCPKEPVNLLPNPFAQLRLLKLEGPCMLQAVGIWKGLERSRLQDLKMIDCFDVQFLPDNFTQLSQLRNLVVKSCDNLRALPDRLGDLGKLETLELNDCRRIHSLPSTFGQLASLRRVHIIDCLNLTDLPDDFVNLSQLVEMKLVRNFYLTRLPSTFGQLPRLQNLEIHGCSNLQALPENFGELHLEYLKLSVCRHIHYLPDSFGQLFYLRKLEISFCIDLVSLPDSFGDLINLEHLTLSRCLAMKSLPDTFGQLSELKFLALLECSNLQALPEGFGDLGSLEHLKLSWGRPRRFSQLIPDSFGDLPKLQRFGVCQCWDIKALQNRFKNVEKIQQHIDVINCSHGYFKEALRNVN